MPITNLDKPIKSAFSIGTALLASAVLFPGIVAAQAYDTPSAPAAPGAPSDTSSPGTPSVPDTIPMTPAEPDVSMSTPSMVTVFQTDLSQGDNNADVMSLQMRLAQEGIYSGPITGFFGPLTFNAVIEYQQRNGLPPTGFVGPLTREKLNSSSPVSATTTPMAQSNLQELVLQIDLLRQRVNELMAQFSALQSTQQQTPTQFMQPMQTAEIIFTDSGFSPSTLTVKAGTNVTFKNQGSMGVWPASAMHPTHDVYPVKGGCISSAFDACKTLQPGEEWSFNFDEKGEWGYHDHLNVSSFGKIIVE